jgi:hypothetical protein
VIVIVGSPIAQPASTGIRAGGLGTAIGLAAAAAGAAVQVVGRVGEDAAGDEVLLSLAAAGIGHVAVLREAGRPTPSAPPPPGESPAPDGPTLGESLTDDDEDAADGADPDGLSVDAADVELALRYVPDYRVVIVTQDVDPAALIAVAAGAAWAGARLIVLVGPEATVGDPGTDATVLARPTSDPDGSFAAMVAGYAVELDRGSEPAAAFAAAQRVAPWSVVAD